MSKVKEGDKVWFKDNVSGEFGVGFVTNIRTPVAVDVKSTVDYATYCVFTDGSCGDEIYLTEEHVEPKFKIGDRVKFKDGQNEYETYGVVTILRQSGRVVYVRADGVGRHTYAVYTDGTGGDEIELLEEPELVKHPNLPAPGTPKQVGGDHYTKMAITPTQYILANDIGWCEANAIKYLSRWKSKNGLQDLEKALHYVEILIADVKAKENK